MTNPITNSNLIFKQYQIYFLIGNFETDKYLIYSSRYDNSRYIPNVMTQINQDNLEEVALYHISRLVGEKEAIEAIEKSNKDKKRSGKKGTIKNQKQENTKENESNNNGNDSDGDIIDNIIQLKKLLNLKIKKSPVSSSYQPSVVLVIADISDSDLVAVRKDTEWVSGEEVLELAEGLKGREKELLVGYLERIRD